MFFGSALLFAKEYLVQVVVLLLHEMLISVFFGIITLEVTNGFPEELGIAESLDGRFSGQLGDGALLLEESLDSDVVSLSVLHPVDREEVSEA